MCVYIRERVSVYIFLCKQTFSVPQAIGELLVAMPEGSRERQGQKEPSWSCPARPSRLREKELEKGERGTATAAAGERSRRLQQELCKFLTRHSWLGTEKWKSTFLPKVEAGGLHYLSTMPLQESNERRGKLKHRQE